MFGSWHVVVSYRDRPTISTVAVHSNAKTGVVGESAVVDNHLRTVGDVQHTTGIKVPMNEGRSYS